MRAFGLAGLDSSSEEEADEVEEIDYARETRTGPVDTAHTTADAADEVDAALEEVPYSGCSFMILRRLIRCQRDASGQ